eukprot:TRINITY_DN54618_c0_g1_i1.p1 TRINITY_DN54618_c0_g1~~TRINITY_DN54618_c0_g1_i1.p1  ORF type:complete len:762 (-),score=136.20 TRINITY_DN54618_c0_g1_i1:56-2221(-)
MTAVALCRTEASPRGSLSARFVSQRSLSSRSPRLKGAALGDVTVRHCHVPKHAAAAADARWTPRGWRQPTLQVPGGVASKSTVGQAHGRAEGVSVPVSRKPNICTENAYTPAHREDLRPRTLTLSIIAARNLRNADPSFLGKSDPYCVVEVVGKSEAKFQTNVIKDCSDPDWNYVVQIPGWIPGEALELSVWDKNMWPKSDDFLGRATLPSETFFPDCFSGELPVCIDQAKPGFNQTFLIVEAQAEEMEPLPLLQKPVASSLQSSPRVGISRGLLPEGANGDFPKNCGVSGKLGSRGIGSTCGKISAYSDLGLTDSDRILSRCMTPLDVLRFQEESDWEELRSIQRERRKLFLDSKRSEKNKQMFARRAAAEERRDASEKSQAELMVKRALLVEDRRAQSALRKAQRDSKSDVHMVPGGLSSRMRDTMSANVESLKSSKPCLARSPRSPKAELQYRSPATSWGMQPFYMDRQDCHEIDMYITLANNERELHILQAKELKAQDRLRRQKAEELIKAQQQAHIEEIRKENQERKTQELLRRKRDRDVLLEQWQQGRSSTSQGKVQTRSMEDSPFVESGLLSEKAEAEAKSRAMRRIGEEGRLIRQAELLRQRDRNLVEKKEQLARVKQAMEEQQIREAYSRQHEPDRWRLSVQSDGQHLAAEEKETKQPPGVLFEEDWLPIREAKEPTRSVLATSSLESVLADRQRRKILGIYSAQAPSVCEK